MSDSNKDTRKVEVTGYLQVEPDWGMSGQVISARAVNFTQRKPGAAQRSGTLTVPVKVRVPVSLFEPLKIEIDVEDSADLPVVARQVVDGGE